MAVRGNAGAVVGARPTPLVPTLNDVADPYGGSTTNQAGAVGRAVMPVVPVP